MTTGQLTYKGAVYPWHCDHMGHMNVMWYVGKFDEATWAYFASLGLTPAKSRDNARGMAALEQNLTYKREVLPGDTLEIYTSTVEIKDKTVRFNHEMIDCETGEIVSICELLAVHMDTNARKAIALPKEVQIKAVTD